MNDLLNTDYFVDYTNDIYNDNSSGYILRGINKINNYIPTEIRSKVTPNKIENGKNLIYKSIFPKNERIIRNKYNHNNNVIKNSYYNHINENANINHNNKNPNLMQPRKSSKMINIVDNTKENNSLLNDFYNNNDYSSNINYLDNYISKNIKFPLNSSNDKRKKSRYKINTLNTADTENGRKINIDIYSDLKGVKYLKTQKSEDNLNIILDKDDFMKNIKEINDLNILDEIDKKNGQYFSTAEKINLNIGKPYISSNEQYEKEVNIIKRMPLISKPKNNKNIRENKFINYINENNKNDNFVINKLSKKNSHNQEKINKFKIKTNENKFFKNKTYNNRLIINDDSLYNNTENLLQQSNPILGTISHINKEESKSLPKNLSFEEKAQQNKKNKNTKNNYSMRIYGNKNIPQKNLKNSENVKNLNPKEIIKRLNNIIKEKNKKINNYNNIIRQYKEKINAYIQNNIKLNEEKKKNLIILNKYKNEINSLKDKLDKMNKIDFVNHKYNSDNKIRELERQLDKYKKENKKLKLLLMKNKNNQMSINEEIDPRENLINKFNTSSFIYENHRKKSYSVSKNRHNMSFFSSKTFLEDEIEMNHDIKKENHELN